MKFTFLTIHPEQPASIFSVGLLRKAVDRKLIELEVVNIRDFADAPHFRVDDKPFGGGPGMVLKVEPIARALRSLTLTEPARKILLSAKGKPFTQKKAEELSKLSQIVFICGRYEGVDERVAEHYVDEELSIGDYVMMGGELAAGVIVETVARLIPGILGNFESTDQESFSEHFSKEHAHYTRPRKFEAYEVPEVLLKGDHSKIDLWRKADSK